jgi:hypothetical protein
VPCDDEMVVVVRARETLSTLVLIYNLIPLYFADEEIETSALDFVRTSPHTSIATHIETIQRLPREGTGNSDGPAAL